MQQKDLEYAIKYRVIKLDEYKYLLFPVSLEKGIELEEGFKINKKILPRSYEINDTNKYVVDNIYEKDELEYLYDYEEDDEFLGEYFYEDLKDVLLLINTKEHTRNEIDLRVMTNKDITYFMDETIPSIILNENTLNELLNSNDIDEIKLLLNKYKLFLNKFNDFNREKGVTKIKVSNGKIENIETTNKVEKKDFKNLGIKYGSELEPKRNEDISYTGLRNYLKERIYGHDDEIDTLAQILYMNYTAEKGESIESILLVGPTGTGKTETVKAASEYLDIPSVFVNASNIVPQGIKGMSIEDVIVSLYEKSDNNLSKAERGIVFLDEFDKLNDSDVDIKAAVKNILLTFTAGGTFPIDTDRHTFSFDSSMTNKIYAGVFDRINVQEKGIGFNSHVIKKKDLGTEEEIRKKIIDQGYFSQEELTRISTILAYNDLDRETKKQILLGSKLSEFRKKKERYKRQFNIDLIADETYIDAIIDSLESSSTGMRSVNNYVKRTINNAEKAILENNNNYKKLLLTKHTVEDPNNFDLSK